MHLCSAHCTCNFSCKHSINIQLLLTCPKRMEILAKDLSINRCIMHYWNQLIFNTYINFSIKKTDKNTSELSEMQPRKTWGLQETSRCLKLKSLQQKWFQGQCLFEQNQNNSVIEGLTYTVSNTTCKHLQFSTTFDKPWKTAMPPPRFSFISHDLSTSCAYNLRRTQNKRLDILNYTLYIS